MKKLLVVLFAAFCASTVMVQAQDTNSAPSSAAPSTGGKKHLTAAQQQLMDEMLAKYDTNKDGKIDKTERAAMTPEDKQKMIDAGLMKAKKPKTDAGASTNAPAGNN
jgi:hypothetical protein